MQKPDKGFTLIELMATIAVASVLTMIAVPAFIDMIRNNRIAAQVNDFVSSLSLARAEALKRQRRVVMCRSSDAATSATPNCGTGSGWQDGWMVFVDQNGNAAFDPPAEDLLSVQAALSGGNTITANNNVINRVSFLPNGVVGIGGTGAFLLEDPRASDGRTQEDRNRGTRLLCMGMTGRTRLFRDGTRACPGGS